MGRGLKIAKAAALATDPKIDKQVACKHLDQVKMRDNSVRCVHCGLLLQHPYIQKARVGREVSGLRRS